MATPGFDLARDRALLERTPRMLATWLGGFDRDWLEIRESPEHWSPREVLGHLVHGEETDWIARARLILEHGEARVFEPFDRTAQERRFAEHTSDQLLELFGRRRAESLAALDGLPLTPADLARTGTHPELGRVTLDQLLCTWVVHDSAHTAQIARTLAKHHAADVGPWGAFIGVLSR